MHSIFNPLWLLNDIISSNILIKNNAIKAAVVVIIYKKYKSSVVYLIERNIYAGHHSGQMAFPGGKMDISDLTLSDTALREVFEEVGILFKADELFPLLPQWIHVSNHWVQPFYIIVNEKPHFTLNKREINSIFEIPISLFREPETLKFHALNILGHEVISPKYLFEGKVIWGATAIIIYQLFQRKKTKINIS